MVVRLYNTVNLNSTNYGVGIAFVPKTKPRTVGRTQGLYKYRYLQDLLDIQDLMYLFY